MHGAFPLHFFKHSSRDVEKGKKEEDEDNDDDADDDDDDDDDNDSDGNDDTAHSSNAAISSLFTNFGHECQAQANRDNYGTIETVTISGTSGRIDIANQE